MAALAAVASNGPSVGGPAVGGDGQAGACCHGRPGACRFVDARGGGCRWGDACRFCHTCRRVSTYDRIREAISAARRRTSAAPPRQAAPPLQAAAPSSPSGCRRRASLTGLLTTCQELLLEGPLGAALPTAALAALARAQAPIALLMAGSGASAIWRLQVARLEESGLSLAPRLLSGLAPGEVRRTARALCQLRFKDRWHLETRDELDAAVEAVEAATAAAEPSHQLFAMACWYELGPGIDAATLVGSVSEEAAAGEEASPELVRQHARPRLPVFPQPAGAPLELPDGWRFRIVPALLTRPLLALRPMVVVLHSSADMMASCGVSYEARLWSASPQLCAFGGLGLQDERPLLAAEALELLAAPAQLLHVVASVRCSRRFWDVPVA
ncbi:unnamed protein product [Prorocentrum cordatum]|uniref:C3H1-type domain-containing protein n=1 Tax=Prorocentrum cordatum TaxID=2364126 RepID=A0ABN9UYG8_9DINO|nr:unnamed protein product [Polarella glacialis]